MTEIHRHTLATHATHITLFEDRAQVERQLSVSLAPGTHILTLTGITRFVDDQSLVVGLAIAESDTDQTQTDSAFELGSSRVIRKLIATPEHADTPADELDAQLDTLTQDLSRARQELSQCHVQQGHLRELEQSLLAQMRLVPDGELSTPEHFAEALATLDERILSQHERTHVCLHTIEDIERTQQHTTLKLEAARRITHKLVAQVELQLECQDPCELVITLTYMTACALWRPAHRARLERHTDDDSLGRVHVDTLASVWQATGESWEQVTCSLSTARPTQQAAPPLLFDDMLSSRTKSDYERHVIDVSARDEAISTTGVQGARLVNDMPGVDDGGEPLRLEAQGLVDIPSTGESHLLSIETITLPCTIDVVAMPEISQVAHLRAKTIWSHTTPLLAGPVTLIREQELAGQASFKFIAPGEPLDIGFGAESALRIRREVERKRVDKKLTRRRHEQRRITLHISNLSQTPRTLQIMERIPVSEIEQVQITLTESEGAHPDDDGFITIKAHLGPHQHTQHHIAYELDLDPKVNLDF